MKKDLDISNIESKPTVVLVSNQSEFDQLMQHLEREGNKWRGGQTPTEWKPNNFNPPLGIMIDNSLLSWHPLNWINDSIHNIIPFPDYAAKHIKPKRPYPNRVVKSKYDAVTAERDRLQADLDRLRNDNNEQGKLVNYLKEELRKSDQLLESKATEHAHLDTLAKKLRDQRDQARFFAALFGFAAFLFGLAALGLAVAVLVGRLVPVH